MVPIGQKHSIALPVDSLPDHAHVIGWEKQCSLLCDIFENGKDLCVMSLRRCCEVMSVKFSTITSELHHRHIFRLRTNSTVTICVQVLTNVITTDRDASLTFLYISESSLVWSRH